MYSIQILNLLLARIHPSCLSDPTASIGHIKLMHRPKDRHDIKKLNQSYNEAKISSSDHSPIALDPKLLNNPFISHAPQFQYLIHRIKEYNKLILTGALNDSYQSLVYNQLFGLIIAIGNLHTRQDQLQQLKEVHKWLSEQDLLINQRKDQGTVRYKVLSHDNSPDKVVKKIKLEETDVSNLLPSEARRKEALAFERKWRTAHKQMEIPSKRLMDYKRKSLNLVPIARDKGEKKPPRVVFPKLGKYAWPKENELEENYEMDQANLENPQSVVVEENKPSGQAEAKPEEPVQDLGLGEDPPEEGGAEEEEEQEDIDKLAPRLKAFILEKREDQKTEAYSHKRMNERYLKVQNDFVRKQAEEQGFINAMHEWGARKSSIEKNIMRRIEDMGLSLKYSISYEIPPAEEKMSAADEKTYGLSKTVPLKKMNPSLDLSSDFALPQIKPYEKSIRSDRLKKLKSKFGTLLGLKDYEERQIPESLCQASPKRYNFSEVLERHSKEKERLVQLDEVTSLKQKLAGSKVNIDVKTLALSMCVPQDEQNLPAGFPSKDLLQNPFWVEPAKKKKKKK